MSNKYDNLLNTRSDLYVGLPELKLFDQMISLAAHVDRMCVEQLAVQDETSFTKALSEIAPGAFSILFSIRELIRSGYLFSSEILVRTLLERVAVIAYLRKSGVEGLRLWEKGWPHKSRPSLKHMVSFIDEPPKSAPISAYPDDYSVVEILKEQIDHLNTVIHADPIGAYRNSILDIDNSTVLMPSGPNFDNPTYCKQIAEIGTGLASVLIWELTKALPEITPNGVKS